jgi:hydrazine synthase alpha subunit-like protein
MKYSTPALIIIIFTGFLTPSVSAQDMNQNVNSWRDQMRTVRKALAELDSAQNQPPQYLVKRMEHLETEFPIEWDWLLQDCQGNITPWFAGRKDSQPERKIIQKVIQELGSEGQKYQSQLQTLIRKNISFQDSRWLTLYHQACEQRRAKRLQPLLKKWPRIVFTKHFDLGGSHYAYTEAQSDAQHERNFKPGSALCILEMDGLYPKVHTLLQDSKGVIRDPDVSFDGKRILFAWKKSDRRDDYHLYEMDGATQNIRQITDGLGFADYEGAYLPNDDIILNSTRCVQIVDCWWTEVSNLYTCDQDGRFLRRLSFDQVHTNFPTVLEDGRVIYTRWDYNDRAQIYPQPLFVMNYDGTAQTEFYGNNSWFPTTILHARGIPGTQNLLAVLSGHHTHQRGKLAIIDPARGRQENSGVQLIAPVRKTEAVKIDAYGQDGDQFQYPYPLDENQFLITYTPYHSGNRNYQKPYGIYFMNVEGQRELLVWDRNISCNQPIPLAPREQPHIRPSIVDYRKSSGAYYIQDIYQGEGLKGIPRGTVKKLRVVALEFRAAGIGDVRNHGPGGGALASTPIGIGNTSWDVKVVLGDAKVHEDGSALFAVPARTPVYFQALDAKGHMVQTMRSWSTLQPNETFSCVGCHENKNGAPPSLKSQTLAMKTGPESLQSFYGPPRGFSFVKEIQPILDRHCIRCHCDRHDLRKRLPGVVINLKTTPKTNGNRQATDQKAFSLLGVQNEDFLAKRKWSDSYLALTQAYSQGKNRTGSYYCGKQDGKVVNWINVMSEPTMLPPYYKGSSNSKLITMLAEGHNDVTLSREEMDKLACWIDLVVPYCGDYTEANLWTPREIEKYQHYTDKRKRMEQLEQANINQYIQQQKRENEISFHKK